MDKLDELFQLQKELDEEIIARRELTGIPMEHWVQKDILAIISELGEVLDEVNFKWWKNPKEIDPEALSEELVDVLHFFISMCIHAGLDAHTLHRIYVEKNKENFNRQLGRSKKPGYFLKEGF